MRSTLPGFETPAVGFEQPFEMLEACHERVQRSLALLRRLVDHVDANGHDAQSRAAARDVLRYFDIAAPHHHEDEERHVFPRLLASGDAALAPLVRRLQDEHRRMAALWARLRVPLQGWTGEQPGPLDASLRRDLDAFLAIYDDHIAAEEAEAYPAARRAIDAAALAAMGAEMSARRRAA